MSTHDCNKTSNPYVIDVGSKLPSVSFAVQGCLTNKILNGTNAGSQRMENKLPPIGYEFSSAEKRPPNQRKLPE